MRRALLLLFILYLGSLSFAQTSVNHLTKYTIKDGLSHNQIDWVFEDSRGIIWVGAINGINRYDGTEFKLVAEHSFFDHPRIRVFEDPTGDLWIYSIDKPNFLLLFNIYTQKFKSLEEKFGPQASFINDGIQSAALLKNGNLVLGLKNKNLIFYDPILRKELDKIETDFIAGNIYPSLKNNGFWFYQKKESYHENRIKRSTYFVFVDENKKVKKVHSTSFFPAFNIGSTYEDELIFSDGLTHYQLNPSGHLTETSFAKILGQPSKFYSYHTHEITYCPHRDQYWFFEDDRVMTYSPKNNIPYSKILVNKKLEVSAKYYAYVSDDFLWVATFDGLFKIDIRSSFFGKLLHKDPVTFSQRDFYSCRGICGGEDNTIFVCSSPELFGLKDSHIIYEELTTKRLNFAIIYDTPNIWTGSKGSLVKYNLQTKEKKVYSLDRKRSNLWSLYKDVNERLWIASMGGLQYLDPGSEKIKEYDGYNGYPFQDEHTNTYSFYTDQNDRIWLTTSSGLYQFDINRGLIGRYWSGGTETNFLPAQDIRHIHQDKKGVFWLACNEGLVRWDEKKNESKLFDASSGFPKVQLYAIYEDEYGFLWISSDNGIIQFEKSTERYRIFYPEDGITHQEFNRISHFQAKDGTIYFGGLNGVTYFHPKDFQHSFNAQPAINLILTECNLYSKKSKQKEDQLPILRTSGEITLAPGDKFLHFKFALLDYNNPNQIQYAYAINSSDSEAELSWTTTTENSVHINYLPYGAHELIIKGKTANGKYSSKMLHIPIFVNKPFYLKNWFFICLLLAVFGAAYLYQKIKTYRLQQRQNELEGIVTARTKTILTQKEELLELDKLKTQFLENISHEFRTPLTIILNSLEEENVMDLPSLSKSETVQYFHKKDIQILRKNAYQLQGLIQQLLELTQLESGKIKLRASQQNFSFFLEELIHSFQPIAHKKNITLHFLTNKKEVALYFDREKIERVFYNLLSNALKFTPENGKIAIDLASDDQRVLITITDSGIGIPDEDLKHIFNRFYQVKRSEAYAFEGTGLGLAIVKDFVQLHHGTIEVESKINAGTTFLISLPISNKHLQPEEIVAPPSVVSILPIEKLKVANAPSIDGTKPVLLLIEDNEDLLYYQQKQFEKDYQILIAKDGVEGVKLALEHIPDLILSDVMMPGKNGYDLCQELKTNQLTDHIPILLLTAKSSQEEKIEGLTIGADDYIIKPYNQKELALRLRNQLEQIRNIQKMYKVASAKSEPTTADQHPFVKRIFELMDANISNTQFGVEELADALKLSRSQLFRKLKALTGQSPANMLRSYRLKKAHQLLENFEGNASEVAYMVGFSTPNYFYKCFKAEFGITPSEFLNTAKRVISNS